MGIESFGENERALHQREDALKDGYHFDNLFDQNEDEAGEKIDLITGKQIRNDTDTQPESIRYVSEKELTADDAIVKEIEDDITTKWFLSQGLDKFGNEIPKDGNGKNVA
jgi:hypothetical protein